MDNLFCKKGHIKSHKKFTPLKGRYKGKSLLITGFENTIEGRFLTVHNLDTNRDYYIFQYDLKKSHPIILE